MFRQRGEQTIAIRQRAIINVANLHDKMDESIAMFRQRGEQTIAIRQRAFVYFANFHDESDESIAMFLRQCGEKTIANRQLGNDAFVNLIKYFHDASQKRRRRLLLTQAVHKRTVLKTIRRAFFTNFFHESVHVFTNLVVFKLRALQAHVSLFEADFVVSLHERTIILCDILQHS